MKAWRRLLTAIYRREPWSHIRDLYGLATGRLIVCGKLPHEYLEIKRKANS